LGRLTALALLLTAAHAAAAEVTSLAGQWAFDLDPNDVGVAGQWFARDLGDTCRLPGSTDENRKGALNTRPANYNGLSRVYEYVGAAWYQRDVTIPEGWRGRRTQARRRAWPSSMSCCTVVTDENRGRRSGGR